MTLVVVFPFVFDFLRHVDDTRGLIWFGIHQLYYLPLGAWIKEPLFNPDSEVGFFVMPLGQILTPIVYLLLFYGIKYVRNKFSQEGRTGG